MSLIDSLRNWGESLFTFKKAYISNQAMPSTSEISVSASEGEGSFTAPSDGYLVLGASRKFGDMSMGVPAANIGWGLRCFAPLKKGASCVVQTIGLSSVNIKFYKLVGRGPIAFCRWFKSGFGEVCYG